MRFSLFYKIILINALSLFLSLVLPITTSQHTEFILIAATFLFGTIYSFEIFIVLGNFAELKKLMATECANLVFIYHTAKDIGPDPIGVGDGFLKNIEEKIEKYTLTSIDYSLKYHVSSTDQDFLSIAEPIRTVEVKGERQFSAINAINKSFHKIVDARYHLEQVAPREIGLSEWTMLILLGLVLIIILFLGREDFLASRIFSAIFAANVIGLLFLLDEADSNHIQETKLEYEIFNQVLKDIGKLPYYPKFAIKKGLIKPKEKSYRIGVFPNYPNLSERKIELITK